jgi:hypothetical protein
MLCPLWKALHDLDSYTPQIIVTLPIFRLFSPKAQAGIMAHEFAHAVRASKFGPGWHEKVQTRYAAEERLADLMAGCVANKSTQTGYSRFVLFETLYLWAFQRCLTRGEQLKNRICNTSFNRALPATGVFALPTVNNGLFPYQVAPDGRMRLLRATVEKQAGHPLTLIVNWLALMREGSPAP